MHKLRGGDIWQHAPVYLLVIGAVLAAFVLGGQYISARSGQNVNGWAWASNIGWISFNSNNCDSDDNNLGDFCTSGAFVPNYGVHVDASGNLSGHAWINPHDANARNRGGSGSDNIGWLTFDQAEVNDPACPDYKSSVTNPCGARLDPSSGKLSGWARVLSGAEDDDGWDGWIKLRGFVNNDKSNPANEYGVSAGVPFSGSCSWEGWAWGGNVMGWIKFKGNVVDDGGVVNGSYGVSGKNTACKVGPPPPPTCPFIGGATRTIVDFPGDEKLYSVDSATRKPRIGPLAAPLKAGSYSITLASYDESHVIEAPDPDQNKEQWRIEFLDSSDRVLASSDYIRDLADTKYDDQETVNANFSIPLGVVKVVASHISLTVPPFPDSKLHSIEPVCAAFELTSGGGGGSLTAKLQAEDPVSPGVYLDDEISVPNDTDVNLIWTSTGADECELLNNSGNRISNNKSGNRKTGKLSTGTYTYQLICKDDDGNQAQDSMIVNVASAACYDLSLTGFPKSLVFLLPDQNMQTFSVSVTPESGFQGKVTLRLTDLSGVTLIRNPVQTVGKTGGTVSFTVEVDNSALQPHGDMKFVLTGTHTSAPYTCLQRELDIRVLLIDNRGPIEEF